MKNIFIVMALLGAISVAHPARTQNLSSPYIFTCSDYIAAQQGQERGQANAMAYWAVGYLQARLAPLPETTFDAETFSQDIRDVHVALMRICPNVLDLVIAEFMSNLADDFERSAKPQQ
ncbi:MAG: hypothetical protein ACK4F5_14315 [Aliihoeflea sp.]